MKTKTHILKTRDGKTVATAYPWDSQKNRDWQRKKQEQLTGEKLEWQPGPDAEVVSA